MEYSAFSDSHNSKTVAELCEAIADGVLPAAVEKDYYVVTRRDLSRWHKESSYDKMLLMLLPEEHTRLNIAS